MSDNTIQSIIDQLNISDVIGEYITIRKKGKNYWAICPFHEDNHPSLSISNDKKIFKCFSCGTSGNVIGFVADYEKISFKSALKKLATKAGIEFQDNTMSKPCYNEWEQKIIDALNEAKNFFQYNLSTLAGREAMQYLSTRNISIADTEKYVIGYALEKGLVKFLTAKGFDKATLINASLINEYGHDFFRNRIMFTILNEHGDAIGFAGRIMKGEGPKYINSRESRVFKKSQIFYNINNAAEAIRREREVYINEGFMDVIALDKVGVPNTLAVMGTALTSKHMPFLRKKQVNLMFDFDDVGIKAALKSIKLLLKNGIHVKIITNIKVKDADEILQKYGQVKMLEMLKNKKNVFDFIYKHIQKPQLPQDVDAIKNFLQEFGQYLKYGDETEKNFYILKAAKEFNMSSEIIASYVPSHVISQITVPHNANISQVTASHNAEVRAIPKHPPINYSYVLIKSLVKNPDLLKYFKFDEVHFFDAVAMNIAKYLAKGKKDQKVEEEFKGTWSKINEQIDDSVIIRSKEELKNAVEYINRESRKATLRSAREKIRASKSEVEQKALLKSINKFQREKGK